MTDPTGLDLLPIDDDDSAWAHRGTDADATQPSMRSRVLKIAGAAVALLVVALVGRWVMAGDNSADRAGNGDSETSITLTDDAAVVIDARATDITVAGFAAGTELVVRQCLLTVRPQNSLTSRCDTGTLVRATVTGTNTAISVVPWREITVDGDVVDCALTPCVIQAADLASAANSAAVALEFDDSIPASDFPRIASDATTDLVHEQRLVVSGENLPAGAPVRVVQCLIGFREADLGCDSSPTLASGVVTGDGTFSVTFEAKRFLIAGDEWYDCAALAGGECALMLRPASTDTSRQPAAVPVHFDPLAPDPRDTIELLKSRNLLDGENTTARVQAAFLGSGDPEVVQCAVGSTTACASVPDSAGASIYSDGFELWVTFPVLRRFTTWNGSVHDCVDMAPCEVQVWTTTGSRRSLSAEISFDPNAAVRPPVGVTLTTPPPFTHDQTINIEVDGRDRLVELSQCIQAQPDRCRVLVSDITNAADPSGTILATTVSRVIVTDDGIHDCLIDGPCFIVPWAGHNEVFDSVTLEFDPNEPGPIPLRAEVRPGRSDLVDGTRIEVLTMGTSRQFAKISLCHQAASQCVWISTVPTPDDGPSSIRFDLPRYLYAPASDPGNDVLDCAPANCSIRVETTESLINTPLTFRTDAEVAPAPELALDTRLPSDPDEVVWAHGRNFDVLRTRPGNIGTVQLALCDEHPDNVAFDNCEFLITGPTGDDGSFTIPFTLPTLADMNQARPASRFCADSCWLVALTNLGLRMGALPIELYSSG